MSWFARNRELLAELFLTLGVEAPLDDGPTLAAWAQQAGWVGEEHGRQPGKPVFAPEVAARARPILARLGLDGEVLPPSAEYDEVLVMGAAGIGIYRRLDLVRRGGVAAPVLTVLAGARPHEASGPVDGLRLADGTLSELLDPSGRFAAAPGWRPPPAAEVQARLLAEAGVDDFVAAAVVFPSEAQLAELMVSKLWPRAEVTASVHLARHEVENELGQRAWFARTWATPATEPIATLRVLNGAPVERSTPEGTPLPPRPTSLSTVREWLDVLWPFEEPRRLLVVANQPHLGRVREQVGAFLRGAITGPLTVDVAGCATLADVDVVLLLGEIPRWIRADP